jgi:hypothetical protein
MSYEINLDGFVRGLKYRRKGNPKFRTKFRNMDMV